MSLLQLDQISYTYPGDTGAVCNLSLVIEKGSKVVLMGPNGSGKSTLFLILAGVLKPQSGRYLLNTREVQFKKQERRWMCQTIGYVFQDPDVQVVTACVKDDVAFGLRNLGLPEPEVQDNVNQYLELTGIPHLKEAAIHTLSYGQKKQVALAGVLAMDPDIILLDEPFAWLDYRQSQRLKKLLNELSAAGKTVVVSTHDSNFAAQWGEKVLVMQKGRLAVAGAVQNIMTDHVLLDQLDLEPPVAYLNDVNECLLRG